MEEIEKAVFAKYRHILLALAGLFEVEIFDDIFIAAEQLQAENEQIKKLLEAKGSIDLYQRGFEDGKKTAVEICKRVIQQEFEQGKKGGDEPMD